MRALPSILMKLSQDLYHSGAKHAPALGSVLKARANRSVHLAISSLKQHGAGVIPSSYQTLSTSTTVQQSERLLYSVLKAPDHKYDSHLERPSRIDNIMKALKTSGLLASPQVTHLPAGSRKATLEEMALVHSYAAFIERHAEKAAAQGAPLAVADVGDRDGCTFLTGSSYNDARLAVGAVLNLVDAVCSSTSKSNTDESTNKENSNVNTLNNEIDVGGSQLRQSRCAPSAFALVRPPGHHATPKTPLGFCIFNNVAIAAKYAQQKYGMERVLVFDFDVHNGNGTTEIFYSDPSVMMIDAFEPSVCYPSPDFVPCSISDIGAGKGKGYTAHVCMPKGAGHDSILRVMDNVIEPLIKRFKPDLILVSAGYDGHQADPLGLLQYKSSTYYSLATILRRLSKELCEGRLVYVLEGGYDLRGLSEGVTESWLGLLGLESMKGKNDREERVEEPMEDIEDLIQDLKEIHRI